MGKYEKNKYNYNYKINHNYKIMKKIRVVLIFFRGKSNYEILGNDKKSNLHIPQYLFYNFSSDHI